MNKNLLILAMLTFLAGLTNLVVSGMLPYIAQGFHVSIPIAGNLITIFTLFFALAEPILMSSTASINRKKLLIVFIILFIFGNVLSALSVSFTMLMTVYFFVLLAFIVTQYNVSTLSINVMLLGLTGWSMNAPTQMRLIQISDINAGFNQTFSTSSTQFGMALGSTIGGLIIAWQFPYNALMIVGSIFIVLALLLIKYSYKAVD